MLRESNAFAVMDGLVEVARVCRARCVGEVNKIPSNTCMYLHSKFCKAHVSIHRTKICRMHCECRTEVRLTLRMSLSPCMRVTDEGISFPYSEKRYRDIMQFNRHPNCNIMY